MDNVGCDRGIHGGNPHCDCGVASRQDRAGVDSSGPKMASGHVRLDLAIIWNSAMGRPLKRSVSRRSESFHLRDLELHPPVNSGG